jgi:hypothetical protein
VSRAESFMLIAARLPVDLRFVQGLYPPETSPAETLTYLERHLPVLQPRVHNRVPRARPHNRAALRMGGPIGVHIVPARQRRRHHLAGTLPSKRTFRQACTPRAPWSTAGFLVAVANAPAR